MGTPAPPGQRRHATTDSRGTPRGFDVGALRVILAICSSILRIGSVVTYQAKYYRDAEGYEPVSDFIDAMEESCQDSVDWKIGLLNKLSDSNPNLPFPHSSALKGNKYRAFRELRADCGNTHYRLIFCRSGRFFILLHILYKNTGEISEGDKDIALARWEDFKARMDATPRRPPRAMGHDAP